MKMNRFIIFIFSIIFLASCSESKMLQSSLSKYKVPINYLYDSKVNNCIKKDTIFINGLSKLNFDLTTNVTKLNQKVIPLLIYNYSEINLNVKLGQSSIDQQFSDFFINSFIAESQRSGCFISNKQLANKGQYSLDISIDSCKTTSVYQRKNTVIFLLFAYTMSFQELGFPSKTILNVNINLRKDDKIVFTKNYKIDRQQPFVFGRTNNTEKLRSDFTTNMVESLSLTTKQCIENIINDLNEYLNTNK